MAASALGAEARASRRIGGDAARRRPDDREAAREARPRDGRRPPLAASSPLRGARAVEADLRPLRRRGGGHRGGRPIRDEPPARAAEDPHGANRGRDRRDQGDLVQPAVARVEARRPARRFGSGAARTGTASPSPRTTSTARRRQATSRRCIPRREDVAQKRLRDLHAQALDRVRDVGDDLPAALLAAERLPIRADALSAVHRPRSLPEAEVGRARLAFDELLVLRLALLRTAAARESASAQPLGEPGELIARYRASLPFTLTPDQERAMAEIDADLDRPVPMQRLLQGEVGSGQDGRRAVRVAPCGRGGASGRADGADRDARRAALPHDRRAVRAARRTRRAADELVAREGARVPSGS